MIDTEKFSFPEDRELVAFKCMRISQLLELQKVSKDIISDMIDSELYIPKPILDEKEDLAKVKEYAIRNSIRVPKFAKICRGVIG